MDTIPLLEADEAALLTGSAPARAAALLRTMGTLAFRPYDLAVQCVLLIAKRHLKDRIQVSSGGSDFHWNDARSLCYAYLGHPLNQYRIDRDAGLVLV